MFLSSYFKDPVLLLTLCYFLSFLSFMVSLYFLRYHRKRHLFSLYVKLWILFLVPLVFTFISFNGISERQGWQLIEFRNEINSINFLQKSYWLTHFLDLIPPLYAQPSFCFHAFWNHYYFYIKNYLKIIIYLIQGIVFMSYISTYDNNKPMLK